MWMTTTSCLRRKARHSRRHSERIMHRFLLERVVSYHCTLGDLLRTRRQSDCLSAQSCPRRVFKHLAPHTIDLDIENCMFTILHPLVKRMGIQITEDLQYTLVMCAEQRDVSSRYSIAARLRITSPVNRMPQLHRSLCGAGRR